MAGRTATSLYKLIQHLIPGEELGNKIRVRLKDIEDGHPKAKDYISWFKTLGKSLPPNYRNELYKWLDTSQSATPYLPNVPEWVGQTLLDSKKPGGAQNYEAWLEAVKEYNQNTGVEPGKIPNPTPGLPPISAGPGQPDTGNLPPVTTPTGTTPTAGAITRVDPTTGKYVAVANPPVQTPYTPPKAGPAWWNAQTAQTRPTDVSLSDWLQQYTYNLSMPYMDPLTQKSTAEWLSRDNPEQYAPPPDTSTSSPITSSMLSQYLNTGDMSTLIGQLDYDQLVSHLPQEQQLNLQGILTPQQQLKVIGDVKDDAAKLKLIEAEQDKYKQAGKDVQAGLGWLREALETARGALPGATRAQQQLVAGHLNTLMTEAQAEPYKAGLYSTLFENIMNPVTKEAPLSGVFGRSRALKLPSGQFNREGTYRNPGLI